MVFSIDKKEGFDITQYTYMTKKKYSQEIRKRRNLPQPDKGYQ